jgi:hypothetical protein
MEAGKSVSAEVPLLALFGHRAMSGVSPSCASKQTSAGQSEFMGHALVMMPGLVAAKTG